MLPAILSKEKTPFKGRFYSFQFHPYQQPPLARLQVCPNLERSGGYLECLTKNKTSDRILFTTDISITN